MTATRTRLRHAAILLITGLCALSVTSCAVRPRDKNGRIIPTAEELDPAGTLYADSLAEADKSGACSDKTVNVLTCFSWKGHGFEGAQGALGHCLIKSGKKDEGLEWLTRSANAGWPESQKRLARVYAEGKEVPKDDLLAMTWTNLYIKNPSLLSLGVQPDMSVAQHLRGNVDVNTQAEAARRANNWTPVYWKPEGQLDPAIAASCKTKRGIGNRRERLIQEDDDSGSGAGGPAGGSGGY